MVTPLIQSKILLASTARMDGEDPRLFRRAAERREMVRVSRGAYMTSSDWASLDDEEKYRSRVIGTSLASRTGITVSHASAAVLWGIPIVGNLPQFVHVLSSESTGTRSEGLVRRHSSRALHIGIEELDGVALTSFARTVVEFVHTVSFGSAVVALDWALTPSTPRRPKPSVTRAELMGMIDELGIGRGKRDIVRALEFANPLSGSPGESLSRVTIARAGLPAPELQCEFSDARGRIGLVDFWWAMANVIGEFDGVNKYTQDEFMSGQSSAEVVVAEKLREDRLRASSSRPTVSRWGWKLANSPDLLRDHLVSAGVPMEARAKIIAFDPPRALKIDGRI